MHHDASPAKSCRRVVRHQPPRIGLLHSRRSPKHTVLPGVGGERRNLFADCASRSKEPSRIRKTPYEGREQTALIPDCCSRDDAALSYHITNRTSPQFTTFTGPLPWGEGNLGADLSKAVYRTSPQFAGAHRPSPMGRGDQKAKPPNSPLPAGEGLRLRALG